MDLVSLKQDDAQAARTGRAALPWLWGACGLVAAVLIAYSQTLAFTGDEGFHLVAAQLIAAGKRPYLDFCFPQTPLEAYWNAGFIRLFGPSWRVIHAASALATAGAVALMADFVWRRFPERPWRLGAALSAAAIIGLNSIVVEYGTVGQAYALLLLATVAAFRLAVAAAELPGWWWAAGAGVAAGASAASSLLSAPVGPVLLLWIFWHTHRGSRWVKPAAFLAAFAIPFLPIVRLFAQSPWVVWFNLAQYHLYYRTAYWSEPLSHDLEVLTAWANDPQALVTGLLAIAGVVFLWKRSSWEPVRRAEFYLCGWLVLAESAELAFGHPTFTRYFVVVAPFAGVLALAGLYAIGSRVFAPDRPFWPVLVLSVIISAVLARAVYDHLAVYTWPEYEDMARKVQQVTPPGAPVFAVDVIYFLTRRRPPPGMEFDYSHRLSLPPARMAALHILPEAEIKQRVLQGKFAAAITCDDDDIDTYGFDKVYAQKAEVHGCSVFWSPKAKAN